MISALNTRIMPIVVPVRSRVVFNRDVSVMKNEHSQSRSSREHSKTPKVSVQNQGKSSPTVKELRLAAETEVAQTSNRTAPIGGEELLHELQVHQIELEMQNENLRIVQGELERSLARYFELYDLAPIGYLTLDARGDVTESNIAAAKILGLDRRALIGNQLLSRIHPDDQPAFSKFFYGVYEEKIKRSVEIRLVGGEGQVPWVRAEAEVQKADGADVCRMVISDITKLKVAQEEQERMSLDLQRNHQLEALGLLAGGIAHDFNNLLVGIFGYMEAALSVSRDDQLTSYLSKGLGALERARGLTRQLLTFSSGGSPIKKIGPLFPLVEEAARFVLSGSSIGFDVSVEPGLWSGDIDAGQIAQVVENVVINAREAMASGGSIKISAENISVYEGQRHNLKPGDYVRVTIVDSGIGMSKEVIERIFDPFYSTKSAGRGLGLSTSYSIIKRHGGLIEIESVVGRGTSVGIYVPAVRAKTDALRVVVPSKHAGAGSIIIMDDEEGVREVLGRMVSRLGYSAILTTRGEEAIEALKAEREKGTSLAAVMLDLTIRGGKGGRETCAEMRLIDGNIPIFVVSGYSEDPVMVDPAEFGFTASLQKPFTTAELCGMLEAHLGQTPSAINVT